MTKINTLVNQVSVIKDNLKVAIRNKGVSVSDSDPFNSYPTKIGNITTEVNNQDKTVTENGIVYPDAGYTGLGQVEVNVPSGDIHNQDITVTENGTYNAEQGYTGLGTVVVDVEGGQVIHNQDKTVVENGTVFPDAGYTGLGKVTVNVQGETDIVTAINKSHRNVELGDKVWINENNGHYTLVPFGLDTNFEIHDWPTIELDTKIVSNFSGDNYLSINNYPHNMANSEFVFKFTTPFDDISSFQNILNASPLVEIYIENGALRAWIEDEEESGSISCGSIELGTTYWAKVVINNGVTTLSYSTDGEHFIGEATKENHNICPEESMTIGWSRFNDWDRYFKGSIDLSGSYINVSGIRFWTPKVASIDYNTVTGTAKEFIGDNQSGQVYIGDIIEASLGTKSITTNGTYSANDDLLDGYSAVTINVPTGGEPPVLAVKTVTTNGTYNASDDEADGYSSVTVNVAGSGTGSSFGGLSMSYSQQENYLPVIHISGGVLADYASYINSCSGVLAPSGYSYIDSEDHYDDFEKIGNVQVNQATGVADGFDFDDYLLITRPFFPQDKEWEVVLKIKTPETRDNYYHPILENVVDTPRAFSIALRDWRIQCWLTTNSNDWNLMNESGWYEWQADTIYYIKLAFANNYYTFSISEDNETWTTCEERECSDYIPKSTFCLGRSWSENDYFRGKIYLADSYIKVNNQTWWNGRTHEKLPGLLASGVVDDGTAKTYNLFWNNGFVLDTVNEKQDWEWCGLVGVPAHTVYSIEPDSQSELIGKNKLTLAQYVDKNYRRDILLIDRENENFPEVTVTFIQSDLYSNELRDIGQHFDAKSVAFPNLTTITGNHGLCGAFYQDQHLEQVSFPVLETVVGDGSLDAFMANSHKIKSISFPELTSVTGNYSFRSFASGCYELYDISFPKLTTVTGNEAFSHSFEGLRNIEVTFPSLTNIQADNIFYGAFRGFGWHKAIVNFPALTSLSFGDYNNQFSELFSDSEYAEAHFPYSVRHIMENWHWVKDRNFDKASAIISFDLTSGLINFQNAGNCVIARDNEILTKEAGLYYTKEGNPTVDTEHFTLTNFSRSDYIYPQYLRKYGEANLYHKPFCFHGTWEGIIKVKTPTTTDCRTCIFGSEWDGNGTFVMFQYGHFAFLNGWDGWFMDWDEKRTSDSYTGAFEYSTETDYWLKFGRNSETYEYYLEYSTDGINYTKDISYYSDREVRFDAPQKLGSWGWDEEGASNGAVIYLDTFSLINNGEEFVELAYTENKNSDRFNLGDTDYVAYENSSNKMLFGTIENVVDQEVRNVPISFDPAGNSLDLVLNKPNCTVNLKYAGLTVTPEEQANHTFEVKYLNGTGRVINYIIPRTETTAKTVGTITLNGQDITENVNVPYLPERDFTVVGTPTISNNNILSGCSENDYLTTEITDLPEYGFELIIKAQAFDWETGNYRQAFSREDSVNGIHHQFCKIWEDRLGIHTRIDDQWEDEDSEWFNRDYTGYFWYAYKQYDWGFEHYYILDDGYTLDTLPALPENWEAESQWTRCGRRDWKNLITNGHYEIGHSSNWSGDFWPTEIDLNSMIIRNSTTGETYWRAINEAPVQQNQEPEMVTLTVYGGRTRTSYGSGEGHIETFTINGQTYTWNSDFSTVTQGESGINMSKYLTIQVPANTNLPWTATANVNTTVTPSSGTLNISDDYTLNITYYEEIEEDEAL